MALKFRHLAVPQAKRALNKLIVNSSDEMSTVKEGRIDTMKIGIIGAGNVGGTLGTGWLRKGHDVIFGARDLADPKLQTLLKQTGAQAGTVQQAAAFGDVVALTVPWVAIEDAIRNAGKLAGKILLDCTNPTSSPQGEPQSKPSGAEQVAKWAGGARVVKIFNMTGFNNMANPKYDSAALTMLYAGDDSAAKRIAAQLAT